MKMSFMIDRLRSAMRRTRREDSATVGCAGKAARPPGKADAPSLRPPTLMIDLLFGALMLFAFQMGDPNARQVVPHEFDLPTSGDAADAKLHTLLPLKPVRKGDDKWMYKMPDGRTLGPENVAKATRKLKKTPVLVVPRTASVQSYLDAEQPLRQRGLKVGLAVALEGEKP